VKLPDPLEGLGNELSLALFYESHPGLELLTWMLGPDEVLRLIAHIGGTTVTIPSCDDFARHLRVGVTAVRCIRERLDPIAEAEKVDVDAVQLARVITHLNKWTAKQRKCRKKAEREAGVPPSIKEMLEGLSK
jgi:hypothetical protein